MRELKGRESKGHTATESIYFIFEERVLSSIWLQGEEYKGNFCLRGHPPKL